MKKSTRALLSLAFVWVFAIGFGIWFLNALEPANFATDEERLDHIKNILGPIIGFAGFWTLISLALFIGARKKERGGE